MNPEPFTTLPPMSYVIGLAVVAALVWQLRGWLDEQHEQEAVKRERSFCAIAAAEYSANAAAAIQARGADPEILAAHDVLHAVPHSAAPSAASVHAGSRV